MDWSRDSWIDQVADLIMEGWQELEREDVECNAKGQWLLAEAFKKESEISKSVYYKIY